MGDKSSAFGKVASTLCCSAARPRERIVATARSLFHQHGIRGIGVEAIAEAAGTNKMTLYRHFSSKDELIVECLRAVADESDAKWQAIEAANPGDPLGQLRAWVRRVSEWLRSDSRGCDLVNAAVELVASDHPARRLIEQWKTANRGRLVDVCKAAGIVEAELLADTLCLLIDGARVSRISVGAGGPSAEFLRVSEAVIGAFAPAERAAGERVRDDA